MHLLIPTVTFTSQVYTHIALASISMSLQIILVSLPVCKSPDIATFSGFLSIVGCLVEDVVRPCSGPIWELSSDNEFLPCRCHVSCKFSLSFLLSHTISQTTLLLWNFPKTSWDIYWGFSHLASPLHWDSTVGGSQGPTTRSHLYPVSISVLFSCPAMKFLLPFYEKASLSHEFFTVF